MDVAPPRHRWLLDALAPRRRVAELPAVRRGYYPEVEALYVGDASEYLDERSRETLTGRINGPAAIFLDDKRLITDLRCHPDRFVEVAHPPTHKQGSMHLNEIQVGVIVSLDDLGSVRCHENVPSDMPEGL